MSAGFLRKNWIWFAIPATVLFLGAVLQNQGRNWLCAHPGFYLWIGSAYSSHTSQHLLDPYSFTHFLHGFLFWWLLILIFPKASRDAQIWAAVAIESAWEVLENSNFIIERYREATAALGYSGDTILNSISDVFFCLIGLLVARSLGVVRSVIVFLFVELVLLFWIRDGLLLNILMLIYPIEEIKNWQAGQ